MRTLTDDQRAAARTRGRERRSADRALLLRARTCPTCNPPAHTPCRCVWCRPAPEDVADPAQSAADSRKNGPDRDGDARTAHNAEV